MISALLDGTPLLGRRTGIGRYTQNLLGALTERDDVAVSATAFTARGWRTVRTSVPAGVRTRAVPVPARALRALWTRFEFPSVGLLGGRSDVFHGTNFILPPTGRAGGVLTIHDLAYLSNSDTVDTTSRSLLDLVPRGLRRAAAVCTPTRSVAEQIVEAYGPAVPDVVVTPLGVDEHWFSADPSIADHPSIPADYFLFVGTREPRKDLATLLTAYALFRHDWGSTGARDVEGGPPSLLLVGPSGWGADQEPAAGVAIRDFSPTSELRSIVAGARALVMPSRDEGFGLPALEGLAAELEDVAFEARTLADGSVETALGDSPVVIREKVHRSVPMSLDDALYEMELVGHDFYLFVDIDSGRPSVAYRRRGWSYGVIKLEAAVGAPSPEPPLHSTV